MSDETNSKPLAATKARGGPPPAQQAFDILGTIDLDAGLPPGWDALGTGVPNAMTEPTPGRVRMTALDRATPQARPGYVQRWVRIRGDDGRPDGANKAEAMQSGWRPRLAETLNDADRGVPVYELAGGRGGVIMFKDELVLYEMPIATYQAQVKALEAEQDAINRIIYQRAKTDVGVSERYATMAFEGGREASGLIDD
jgi:hypothetical protein